MNKFGMESNWFVLGIVLISLVQLRAHPTQQSSNLPKATCGYDACTPVDPVKLNVHMVPHTHDDVGWLKTLDQYYYGSRTNIQRAGVQYILDSVVTALLKDPARKFIWVETAFFWKWWEEQDQQMQDQFRGLVDSGQMEIISGAWSMNDEAGTHYNSIIDQFTWGFRVLNDTLGECARPRIGWQIDPFGHARESASIAARFGFDGLFVCRLDYQDKNRRLADKHMEVIWSGSPVNLGSVADMFTHATYNEYANPPGFCFDILCTDEPMIDNENSHDYNIPQKVQQFVDYVKTQATFYRSNNIMLTMGEDFYYSDAHVWYKNMDKVIKYVNSMSDVNVFYSTPSCYLKAVHDENIAFPTKTDDFFPYASDIHSYWTGYFTSKPTIKYFERLGNNLLQVSKQLTTLAGSTPADDAGVTVLREAMGVMQHHDAITGTMKDHVAQDYNTILFEAFTESGNAAQSALNTLIGNASPTPVPMTSCLKLNISECAITESSASFVVTIYNPLSQSASQYVRLPVLGAGYTVQGPDGVEVAVQLVPIHASVIGMVGRVSTADTELLFRAENLPPLGFRSYYVTQVSAAKSRKEGTRDSTMGNDRITLTLDNDGITSALNINNISIDLQQTFNYYIGYFKAGERASGAYIFRPNGTDTLPVPIDSYVVYKGDLVEEVHQTFDGGWISQVIRVYQQDNHVEFEWMVGPIPDDFEIGKEVISLYGSNLANDATFYTDSNGRELMKRVRDFRFTWDLENNEPIASNYYPIVTKILLRDEAQAQEMAVLVDRSQGGSSLQDGQLEIMLHRRLFHDDGKGVAEPLNEIQYGVGLIARGKHYLVAGAVDGVSPTLAAQERLLTQRKMLSGWTFFSPAGGMTFQEWADAYTMEFSGLSAGLPDNVNILTLEPWKDGGLLLRLEHILEKGEDPELSNTVTVNLQEAFTKLTINSAEEMTLGGNQLLDQLDRFQWISETPARAAGSKRRDRAVDVTAIALDPMEIRTFIVDYTLNK